MKVENKSRFMDKFVESAEFVFKPLFLPFVWVYVVLFLLLLFILAIFQYSKMFLNRVPYPNWDIIFVSWLKGYIVMADRQGKELINEFDIMKKWQKK